MSGGLKYRSDIDGLRAIAVLGVVLYHFGIGPFRGGFVGVDVFFVISGYLITAIIQAEVSRGQFTFSGFYERRARRIFPALFVVLLATLALGVATLLPSDLRRLGHATLSTLFFTSNLLFWQQSGYFNTASEFNPLLHTWSLAVEEQFYIWLPILLLLAHRFAPRLLRPALVGFTVLSFAACVVLQPGHPSAVFYLSPFRAWELLAGGVLAMSVLPRIENRIWRESLALVAMATLLGSLCWIQAGPDFPGWRAVLPVAATAALIHVGKLDTTIATRVLRWRPFVLVGLVSYSFYLWHWPVLTFARYWNGMEPLGQANAWGLAAVSLTAAAASYRYVETPFRKRSGGRPLPARRLFEGAMVMVAILACFSLFVTLDHGLSRRFPPAVLALDGARDPFIPYKEDCDGRGPDESSDRCSIGDRNSSRLALIWGDSHALGWTPGLDAVLENEGLKGVLAVNSACPPLIGIHNLSDPRCFHDNQSTYGWIRTREPEMLIMIAAWNEYASPDGEYSIFDDSGRSENLLAFPVALENTIENIAEPGRKIIVVGPTPGAPREVPFKLAVSKGARPAMVATDGFKRDSRWFWAATHGLRSRAGVTFVDAEPWFCGREGCRYSDGASNLYYRDNGHLSIHGVGFAAERLAATQRPMGVLSAQIGEP